jgi:hypothetical protein
LNPPDPEIKNVTPIGPLPAGAPAAVPPAGGAAVATAAKSPPSIRGLLIGVVVLLAIVLLGYKLFHHQRNQYESTADAVTLAIAHNDMTPVLHKFNAIRLPELEDRARVGRLSNLIVPLGAFKESKEITPAGSDAGLHEFTETFANGTLDEKYSLDADGKIVRFHIGPPPSATTAP